MAGVVGYNEFKDKMRLYLVNLAQDIRQGKKTEQTIYVLLGPPGIGKSFISEKVAEGMGRILINVDLGGRSDTGILEGVLRRLIPEGFVKGLLVKTEEPLFY